MANTTRNRKQKPYREGRGGTAIQGEEGGHPGVADENTKIGDEYWAKDWTSPMNAQNQPDPMPDNNYITPDKIVPSNPLGIAGVSEAIAQKKRGGSF